MSGGAGVGSDSVLVARADLLALTPDSIAALTNRGLVKRATKEIDAGSGPGVDVEADGTVRGSYADGIQMTVPASGGLESATCTCPATGTCRHLVALVLAYHAAFASTAPTASTASMEGSEAPEASVEPAAVVDWSPGGFTDDAMADLVGARVLTSARRVARAGFSARVRRPCQQDPVPSVELAACTVRFLVPHDLGYVHTDAAQEARDRVLPLAIWAFREADLRFPGVPDVTLDVCHGTATRAGGSVSQDVGGSGLESALALTEEILLDGIVHMGPALAATVARIRRDLDTAGLRWPLLALEELDDQLRAYRDRSAAYRAEHAASLVAELHARHRASCAQSASASPRSRVLGTEEAASTPLRRLRLTSLGCRIGATALPGAGEQRTLEAYLAHPDTATTLVLRRSWRVSEGESPCGSAFASKRVSGIRVDMLSSGDIVSESAVRSASRTVRFGGSRGVASSVAMPFSDSWADLPDGLLVRDLEEASRLMAALPPRLIRPRVCAEFVRAVQIGTVCSTAYAPGDQRFEAVIEDEAGTRATIAARHRAVCPGALDALAAALSGEQGKPRYVSGTLRRTHGGIVIDPLAVVVDGRLVVIDLAADDGTSDLSADAVDEAPSGAIEAAVTAALGLLVDAAHHGLRHLSPMFHERVAEVVRSLTTVGMGGAAACLESFAAGLGPDPDAEAVTAWANATIRLLATDECL